MTTYTAVSGGGNWSSNSTWSPSGHPVQGDTAILNSSSGNVTVDVASACDDLDCTGYTNTLTLSAGLTCYGNWVSTNGFSPNGNTVTFAATSSKNLTCTWATFAGVIFNGAGGEWTLQHGFEATGTVTYTAGTLHLNGKDFYQDTGNATIGNGFTLDIGSGSFNLQSNGDFTVGNGATVTIAAGSVNNTMGIYVTGTGVFTCSGSAYIAPFGSISLNGNFTPSTSTVRMRSNYTTNITSASLFYNLIVGQYGSGSPTLLSSIVVQNDFTIYTGDSLNANGYNITVGENWTNNGSFTAGSGSVIFNDATKTSVITGATTFNTIYCHTQDKTINFTSGQTFTCSAFDFVGASSHLITIGSTSTSQHTLSKSSGTVSVSYCSISYSNATGGATWDAFLSNGCVDGGNNSGWIFSSFTTKTKTYTMDGLLLKHITKTYSNTVLIKKGITKTFSNSLLLRKSLTDNYSNTLLLKKLGLTKSYTNTLLIGKNITKTYSNSAILKKGLIETYTNTLIIRKYGVTKTYTMDLILYTSHVTFKNYSMDLKLLPVARKIYLQSEQSNPFYVKSS